MYNQGDGVRGKQHLSDGSAISLPGSGSVEGGNGEVSSSGSSEAAKIKKTKGSDPALTLMAEAFGENWQQRFGEEFGKGLLGKPTEARNPDDPFDGFGSIEDFFTSQEGESFLWLLSKVLMLLAKRSGQSAADERKTKMVELLHSLEEGLGASASLAEGAKNALVAGIVAGVVGIVGAGVGMGAQAFASRLKGQSAGVGKQMKELEEASADLLRADLPGNAGAGATQSAADVIRVQKEGMVTRMQELEERATKVTSIGDGVGRVSMSASGMGSASSTMMLTTAQAEQSRQQAVSSQQAQAFGIEDDWQKGLTSLRDTILGIVGEAIRAMTQANSAAFK
ncbi:hypothetical protein [Candidatus Ichthyocystis hellenicum]|uniref:hypothetical protein n=1 Tax=Candidatus Ichthyocystis hellenicum TaxID=1561003 RepID=UPI000B86023C|nr:hypothetical protein [Candidatus Ichthyocystis hellenicum]